jgi:hypothetical protein
MSRVHRPLTLVSPRPEGEDVRALQRAINSTYEHYKIDRQIAVDGVFGAQTLATARQTARMMGVTIVPWRKLRAGRVPMGVQRLIRGERRRTRAERLAHARRRPFRVRLRRKLRPIPGELAISAARKYIGTTESPPGSNWGGLVEQFIRFTGYTFPVAWCGCWAAWVVVKLGGAKIPQRIRLGYAPYITEDARAGRNGLTAVPFDAARPGDIITLWNGQHIEVVAERPSGDTVKTIGGNTSPEGGSGSQSNGGGVYERTRRRSDIDCVARPNY